MSRETPPHLPAAPLDPDPDRSADLPYDLAQQTLQRQLDGVDPLDAKISGTFTVSVPLVALLAAVFAIRGNSPSGLSLTLFLAALAAVAVVAAVALYATRAIDWYTGPGVADVESQYRAGETEEEMKWKAVRSLTEAVKLNKELIKDKRRALHICYGVLLVELVLVLWDLLRVTG